MAANSDASPFVCVYLSASEASLSGHDVSRQFLYLGADQQTVRLELEPLGLSDQDPGTRLHTCRIMMRRRPVRWTKPSIGGTEKGARMVFQIANE